MTPEIYEGAGVLLTPDNLDIEHIRFAPQNRGRSRRFEAIRQSFLSVRPGALGTRAGALCLFELVPPEQLEHACSGSITNIENSAYCDWACSGQLHRRELTDISNAYLTKESAVERNDVADFFDWASQNVYRGISKVAISNEIALDQLAWGTRNLSPVLWAHLSGLHPMTAVRDAYFFREKSGLVPPKEIDSDTVAVEADREIFYDSFEDVQGEDSDDRLVQHAVSELVLDGNKTEGENIKTWLQRLLSLHAQAQKKGPITYLVLCWMIDLIESGTFKKTNADIKTRRRYCKVLAPSLFRALKTIEKPLVAWTSAELETSFIAILSTAETDKRATSAALLSFAHFAHDFFDMPLVLISTDQYVEAPTVRAQLVTRTEMERAVSWADPNEGDVALNLMLRALLGVGYAAPFRLRELLYVRKANISRLADGRFEIEVVPLQGKNKLKSPAAKRRLIIDDPLAIETLNRLIEFRSTQGWSSGDLLFGSPTGGEVYRRHALYRSLLALLKATTGDPQMTFHALRHSYASRCFVALLKQPECIAFNSLTQLAENMGHVSVGTTMTYYVHLYEHVLNAHLQRVNSLSIRFNSNSAAQLLGRTSTSVRKRAERCGMSITQMVFAELKSQEWNTLHALSPSYSEWVIPTPPKLSNGYVNVMNPLKVLTVLQATDIPNVDIDSVASKLRIEPQLIRAILQSTVDFAISSTHPKNGAPPSTAPTSVRTALAALHINPNAARNPKFGVVIASLEKCQITPDLISAIEYWRGSRRPGYVGIHLPNGRYIFLALLRSLGFQQSQLLINVQSHGDSLTSASDRSDLVRQFQSIFGLSPQFSEARLPHPKRPKTYLLVAGSKSGSAGESATGLEAILLSLHVFLRLKEMQDA